MRIFTDVLIVLTDRLHANGFDIQMQILRTLITVLDHVTPLLLVTSETKRL